MHRVVDVNRSWCLLTNFPAGHDRLSNEPHGVGGIVGAGVGVAVGLSSILVGWYVGGLVVGCAVGFVVGAADGANESNGVGGMLG